MAFFRGKDNKEEKMLLLDTGIFQRLLGLNIAEVILEDDLDVINKGAIAELYTGLEILKSASCYRQEALYFWHRDAKSSSAEVDYVVQKDQEVVPVEVKSENKDPCKAYDCSCRKRDRRPASGFRWRIIRSTKTSRYSRYMP